MTIGRKSTKMNLVLPFRQVQALDFVLSAWQQHGFEGNRRDVIEALLSYVFFLHRRSGEMSMFPPVELAEMHFHTPTNPQRTDLVFDPTPYIGGSDNYKPEDWSVQ